jgi:hypothetical protein
MNITVRSACVFLLLTSALPGDAQSGEHGWPIAPIDTDHALGNTLGEFWAGAQGNYQHEGIDILAEPFTEPAAPWVVATVAGSVSWVDMTPNSNKNFVKIVALDGVHRYIYAHLEAATVPIEAGLAINNVTSWPPFQPGQAIAKVTNWGCGYDHLHYQVERVNEDGTTTLLNPLVDMGPKPDPLAPDVFDVGLAKHDGTRWNEFETVTNACTVVTGDVDIVAHVRDRDDGGSGLPSTKHVGVHNLRWRACPDSSPDCAWNNTHAFDDMPSEWSIAGNASTARQFSVASPWQSKSNACSSPGNETYMVPTSHAPSGSWKTDSGTTPDGGYSVSVEASDIAGNVAVLPIRVCVQNSRECITDLAVRDDENDTGNVPSIASPSSSSPDIAVNPGAANQNRPVKRGVTNIIAVNVWNRGSCELPIGTTYKVCLGWSSPPIQNANPPVPLQTVQCRSETVVTSVWEPGTSRSTAILWTPPLSVPLGRLRLQAWSDIATDPPRSVSSALLDNNRADRHVTVIAAPGP